MQMMLWPEQQQLIRMRLMTCLPRSALIDQAPSHLSPFLQMQWVRCYVHDSSAYLEWAMLYLSHSQACDMR